jgi:nitrogen fixation protein FixH
LALKSAEKQKNLGWKMEIKYSNFGNKFGAISIKLKDKNRSQISDAILYVNFKRPTQEGFDFTQKLQNFDGIYKSDLSFPLKGQWDFEVVATKGEDVFQEVKRYVVQ